MNNYENLKEIVMEAKREVSESSQWELYQVLTDAFHNVGGPVLNAWKRLTMDICHDRVYCELLDVDYVNLPKEDMRKIYAFTLLLAKKDPSITALPLIEE